MKIRRLNSLKLQTTTGSAGKVITILTVAIFLAVGCKPKPGRSGILAINDMKLVMWDMMVADEFATTYLPKDSIFKARKDSAEMVKKELNVLYQKVFALHKIEQAQFFNSFDFYKAHPEYYKILMDSLSAYGNREREGRFMKTKSSPQPVKLPRDLPKRLPQDSIK